MSTFNIRHVGTIRINTTNNNYYTKPAATDESITPVTTVTPVSTMSLDDFYQFFTIAYREKRKNDFTKLIELLTNPSFSDKDRARFAWAIYQAKKAILMPSKQPHTFTSWYRTCCKACGWNDSITYEPGKLTPNDATNLIQNYL